MPLASVIIPLVVIAPGFTTMQHCVIGDFSISDIGNESIYVSGRVVPK